ncbi:AEC family transporter [Bordetella bronchialis]|uniref:Transporter n=1 Tax=Bordetella bronchialis TaxID=463025 RepID=A0ABM6CWF6_9BORD|nr:AEC family transporter [Bordetella bronchialis]ANN68477.1 transporter [Bordetella bronchialis]
MLSALPILAPIFALILAGFALRWRGIAGPAASVELNRFVVWLALPALMFKLMAHASWAQLYQPAFVAAFGLACAAVFVMTLAWRLRAGRHLADASVDAIAASYANTAYIGFPLVLALFGDAGIAPATVATLLVVSVLFSIAVVLIEVGLQSERRPRKVAMKVLHRMARNPLIVAPAAGAAVAVAGLPVPAPAETFLDLLGAAATPCALVCLGLFLAEKQPAARTAGAAGKAGSAPGSSVMLALTAGKLLLQPALTWWLAMRVFMLPAPLAQMAVLLAALPTGTGPFMLAEFYRREAFITARTILLSTVGSLISLTILLGWMRHGG